MPTASACAPLSTTYAGWCKSDRVLIEPEAGVLVQQTAGNRRVRIYYPFHPLAGQSLWIRERRKGPPPTYTLRLLFDLGP